MDFLPSALAPLAAYTQFIVYHLVSSKTRPGKTDKIPVNPYTEMPSDAHDPASWMDINQALAHVSALGISYGVGFVFTDNDPFWFLDIDDCLEPSNTWSPLAQSLVAAFAGAAVEISTSMRGLHIFGIGVVPPHSTRNAGYKIEFYTSKRFVALTGQGVMGDASIDHSSALVWLVSNYFPATSNPVFGTDFNLTTTPAAEWNGPVDDDDLINRALRADSARAIFGKGAAFRDLWEANQAVLITAWPDAEHACGYNESSADRALAQHLCFWTGNHGERIQRIMLRSALVRDKWNRDDYLPRTINSACAQHTQFCQDKRLENPVTVTSPTPAASQAITGATFLSHEQQTELFRGCTYVCDSHSILIPGGYTLNSERFRVIYGGFSFPMDSRNERVSRNAWEAFTESQCLRHPRADTSTFRPDQTPGIVIDRDGQRLANLWWPVETKRLQGDITPFMTHLRKILPDERDQTILVSYMAACIQHKGIKFQWCPILQGVEGNGKTLFTRCLAYAVGDRYSHFPKAQEIAAKFNDWMYCKIFIGVEDIYTADHKHEIIEALKPMITGERHEIEPKGGAKVTRDICCNFLINTNHKDGLRKTLNDRRFAPFYTAQQNFEDLKRDGMNDDYFYNLYHWLYKQDGLAIVSDFLHSFTIDDQFNPANGQRGPITSSTAEAITHGRGRIEQEIIEAIGQEQVGFRGGWISSMMLDQLLIKHNAHRYIPPNKRRDLLKSLGYDWHEGLKDGRVNVNVLPDGGRPRLYVSQNNKDAGLKDTGLIIKAYTEAQK